MALASLFTSMKVLIQNRQMQIYKVASINLKINQELNKYKLLISQLNQKNLLNKIWYKWQKNKNKLIVIATMINLLHWL